MNRILFVCHGNICRSPMAQFVMEYLVEKRGLNGSYHIDSKATSTEEIGNPPYPPARRKMQEEGIPMRAHRASQITRSDYEKFDLIIGMDSANIRNMLMIFGGDPDHKIYKLREFTGTTEDIADPWYTGNFDITYDQVLAGCTALLDKLESDN